MNPTNSHSSDLPADLVPVAASLDHLGAADAASARAGLEDRVAAAAPIGNLRLVPSDAPARRAWHASPLVRIAALVAIVGGAFAAYLALRPSSPTELPGTIAEADSLGPAIALLDSAAPYDGIESLLAEADRLDAILNIDFLDPDAVLNAGSL